jgi:hypothetical protein
VTDPTGDLSGAIRRTAHLVPPSAVEVEEVLGVVDGKLPDPHAADPHRVPVGDRRRLRLRAVGVRGNRTGVR